ncbi:squalene synthase-like [Forsythia ovata]|uniref:Squalene synthase-like n=1 Tax=Forsythia ovata TaxID=205694 RepID=A0ABD1QQ88_9LAMI
MSILSLPLASISSTAAGRRFAAPEVPLSHFSTSSLRVVSHRNPPLTYCLRETSRLPDREFNPQAAEMNTVAGNADKQIPQPPRWRFLYTMIHKAFIFGAFHLHRLRSDLHNAVNYLSLFFKQN